MKALTICQPFAHLIALPETDPRHKRVENREWSTKYRGPLVIHAGKGMAYMDDEEAYRAEGLEANYGIPKADMAFGAAVAVCRLVDCIHIEDIMVTGEPIGDRKPLRPPATAVGVRYPWLASHQHTEGTYCFVLQDVRPFPKPIPYMGKQCFWNFPDELIPPSIWTRELHETNDGV